MGGDTYRERVRATLKARSKTATWLAKEAGTMTTNISSYTIKKGYSQALKIIARIAIAL